MVRALAIAGACAVTFAGAFAVAELTRSDSGGAPSRAAQGPPTSAAPVPAGVPVRATAIGDAARLPDLRKPSPTPEPGAPEPAAPASAPAASPASAPQPAPRSAPSPAPAPAPAPEPAPQAPAPRAPAPQPEPSAPEPAPATSTDEFFDGD
jgi:hypothetical protein